MDRIRARAYGKVNIKQLIAETINGEIPNDTRYLINYNVEKPGERGYWYEAELKVEIGKVSTRNNDITATVLRPNESPLRNCKLNKLYDIFLLPPRRRKSELPVDNGTTLSDDNMTPSKYGHHHRKVFLPDWVVARWWMIDPASLKLLWQGNG